MYHSIATALSHGFTKGLSFGKFIGLSWRKPLVKFLKEKFHYMKKHVPEEHVLIREDRMKVGLFLQDYLFERKSSVLREQGRTWYWGILECVLKFFARFRNHNEEIVMIHRYQVIKTLIFMAFWSLKRPDIDYKNLVLCNLTMGSLYSDISKEYHYYNFNLGVTELPQDLLEPEQVEVFSNLKKGLLGDGTRTLYMQPDNGLHINCSFDNPFKDYPKYSMMEYDSFITPKYHIWYAKSNSAYSDQEYCHREAESFIGIEESFEQCSNDFLLKYKCNLVPYTELDFMMLNSNSKTYDHESGRTCINKKLKTKKELSFKLEKIEGTYTQSYVYKDPAEIRDLWIPDLKTKETLKYFSVLLGQICSELPNSGFCKFKDLQKKLKKLKFNGTHMFLELDIRKSGKTLPYSLVDIISRVLSKVYPDIPWHIMNHIYSHPNIYVNRIPLEKPKRGIGYGHGNELYTLLLCCAMNAAGFDGLCYNDDMIWMIPCEGPIRKIALFQLSKRAELYMSSLGFVLNPKKKVISKAARFMENYFNTRDYGVGYSKDVQHYASIASVMFSSSNERVRERLHCLFSTGDESLMSLIDSLKPLLYSLYPTGYHELEYDFPAELAGWSFAAFPVSQIPRILLDCEGSALAKRIESLDVSLWDSVNSFRGISIPLKKTFVWQFRKKMSEYKYELHEPFKEHEDMDWKFITSSMLKTFSKYSFENMPPHIETAYYSAKAKVIKDHFSTSEVHYLNGLQRWSLFLNDRGIPWGIPLQSFMSNPVDIEHVDERIFIRNEHSRIFKDKCEQPFKLVASAQSLFPSAFVGKSFGFYDPNFLVESCLPFDKYEFPSWVYQYHFDVTGFQDTFSCCGMPTLTALQEWMFTYNKHPISEIDNTWRVVSNSSLYKKYRLLEDLPSVIRRTYRIAPKGTGSYWKRYSRDTSLFGGDPDKDLQMKSLKSKRFKRYKTTLQESERLYEEYQEVRDIPSVIRYVQDEILNIKPYEGGNSSTSDVLESNEEQMSDLDQKSDTQKGDITRDLESPVIDNVVRDFDSFGFSLFLGRIREDGGLVRSGYSLYKDPLEARKFLEEQKKIFIQQSKTKGLVPITEFSFMSSLEPTKKRKEASSPKDDDALVDEGPSRKVICYRGEGPAPEEDDPEEKVEDKQDTCLSYDLNDVLEEDSSTIDKTAASLAEAEEASKLEDNIVDDGVLKASDVLDECPAQLDVNKTLDLSDVLEMEGSAPDLSGADFGVSDDVTSDTIEYSNDRGGVDDSISDIPGSPSALVDGDMGLEVDLNDYVSEEDNHKKD